MQQPTAMVVEIADFAIQPGRQAEFIAALEHGVASVIARARGYRRHEILGGLETPERCVLLIEWETLEDHTDGFRNSAAFAQWRAIVGPYFARAPQVEHFHRASGTRAGA